MERRPEVLCAGEILCDRFPDGRTVPGGAPANVAFHAATLGCRARLVSAVGRDENGARLRAWLEQAGVDAGLVAETALAPTGSVEVHPESHGPSYVIAAPAAWDYLEEAELPDGGPGVCVFGTLAQRHPAARAAVRGMVARARAAGWTTVADLNLRPPFFDEETIRWTLRHAEVLKVNREELLVVSAMLGAAGETETLFTALLCEFGIGRGVLTLGSAGALTWESGELTGTAAPRTEVADTVGAGDAFCAVLAAALARGLTATEAAPWCHEAAAFVASRPGATPAWPADLLNRVRRGLELETGHGLD